MVINELVHALVTLFWNILSCDTKLSISVEWRRTWETRWVGGQGTSRVVWGMDGQFARIKIRDRFSIHRKREESMAWKRAQLSQTNNPLRRGKKQTSFQTFLIAFHTNADLTAELAKPKPRFCQVVVGWTANWALSKTVGFNLAKSGFGDELRRIQRGVHAFHKSKHGLWA